MERVPGRRLMQSTLNVSGEVRRREDGEEEKRQASVAIDAGALTAQAVGLVCTRADPSRIMNPCSGLSADPLKPALRSNEAWCNTEYSGSSNSWCACRNVHTAVFLLERRFG